MRKQTKIIAFDLDGTLTQHKTKLGPQNRHILDALFRNAIAPLQRLHHGVFPVQKFRVVIDLAYFTRFKIGV